MSFLLDTHVFLWFVSGDKQLPKSILDKIKDINTPCFLSSASLWEITIKKQIGKLKLEITLNELFDYIQRNQIEVLQTNFDHLLILENLPKHHGDPFDRLIISQAIAEDLIIITRDKLFKKYKVNQQWK